MDDLGFSAKEAAALVSGALVGSDDWCFLSACHDTRLLKKGDVFVALSGKNQSGEAFLEEAMRKGAVAALVHEKQDLPLNQLVVKDVLSALQRLALERRKRSKAQFVAITGSNGKTTTKEILAHILQAHAPVLYTKGNYNNALGVPLTLLNLRDKHRYAVIELGANHIGEIKDLSALVMPDVAVVTNVSKAHLAGFGDFSGVVRAKTEIYQNPNARLLFNADLPCINAWRKEFQGREALCFSLLGQGDLNATMASGQLSAFELCFKGECASISWQLSGAHNVYNALAAVGAALLLGVDFLSACKALQGFSLQNSRLQAIHKGKFLVYDDSYNANPASFAAALEVLSHLAKPVVIAGAMAELGQESKHLHQAVYDLAKKRKIAHFLTLNATEYGALDFSCEDDLLDYLQRLINDGEALSFLLKGSRSARMERILPRLLACLDDF